MKKSRILFAFLLTFNGFSIAAADTILGVYARYQYWQHGLTDGIRANFTDEKNLTKAMYFTSL
jgi:hypothetical protein